MSIQAPDELENELRQLGRHVALPATPAISAAVVARLGEARTGRAPWWRLVRGLVLATVLVVLLAGAAVAIGLGLGGIQLRFSDAPRPPASRPDNMAGFGELTTLAAAREAVDFDIVVPTLEALGPPDRVFVAEIPEGGGVTLAWDERPGFLPHADAGFALLITEFRRDIGPETFAKLINSGVEVTEVRVHGKAGYWIAGGTHELIYLDDQGNRVFEMTRLVGDALIWEHDGLTLRVEGAPSLQSALAVAESMVAARP